MRRWCTLCFDTSCVRKAAWISAPWVPRASGASGDTSPWSTCSPRLCLGRPGTRYTTININDVYCCCSARRSVGLPLDVARRRFVLAHVLNVSVCHTRYVAASCFERREDSESIDICATRDFHLASNRGRVEPALHIIWRRACPSPIAPVVSPVITSSV